MNYTYLTKPHKRTKFSPKMLREIFSYINIKTNNLSILTPELLIKKPACLKVIRLMAGLTIKAMSKEFRVSPASIQSIEEERFHLSHKTAKKYIIKIKRVINKYNLKKVIYLDLKKNYDRNYTRLLFSRMSKLVSKKSRLLRGKKAGTSTLLKYGSQHFRNIAKLGARRGGIAVSKKYSHDHYVRIGKMTSQVHGSKKLSQWGRKGGLITASIQPLTNQEKRIKNMLFKNNIQCESHKKLNGKKRGYIVDFIIKQNKTRAIIEATNMSNLSSSYCYSKALELIARTYDIRRINSDMHYIFVLHKQFSIEGAIKLSRIGSILTNNFLEQLPFIVENINDRKQIEMINKKIIKDMLLNKLKFRKSVIASKDMRLTPEEITVSNFLKDRNIAFDSQGVLKSRFGTIRIVDFVIPSLKSPKTIIEVTKITTANPKTLIRTIHRLSDRFRLINDFYLKDVKCIGLVNNARQEDLDKYQSGGTFLSLNDI